jgi:hypothetical protein
MIRLTNNFSFLALMGFFWRQIPWMFDHEISMYEFLFSGAIFGIKIDEN